MIRMSIYGGGLILLILVLRFLAVHRLPKKLFVLLWDIALLRLLFPVSIPVRLVFSPVKKVTDTVIQKAGDKNTCRYSQMDKAPEIGPDFNSAGIWNLFA